MDPRVDNKNNPLTAYGRNAKTLGLVETTGSGDDYTFVQKNGKLVLGHGVYEAVIKADKVVYTVKHDGQNTMIISDMFFRRYDWRKSVAFRNKDTGIVYPLFEKQFWTKFNKKIKIGINVGFNSGFNIEEFFASGNKYPENCKYELIIIGNFSSCKEMIASRVDIKPIGKDNPYPYAVITENSLIYPGEMVDGKPEVVYRPVQGISHVNLAYVVNGELRLENMKLSDILKKYGKEMMTLEEISPHICKGGKRYTHLGIPSNEITLIAHGSVIIDRPDLPIKPIKPIKPGSNGSEEDVAIYIEQLYEFALNFSYNEDKKREGVVIYFGEHIAFKINEGHMQTYAKMKGYPYPSKQDCLSFD
jgi:hypothetical protein